MRLRIRDINMYAHVHGTSYLYHYVIYNIHILTMHFHLSYCLMPYDVHGA